MPVAEENPGSSLGNILSDTIPFLPSGGRRAGMAEMLERRLGNKPSFALTSPFLTQLGGIGAGAALGSVVDGKPATIGKGALVGLLLAQAYKSFQIEKAQAKYETTRQHTRLRDIDGLDKLLNPALGNSGSGRLGRVMAYEAMKKRKYHDISSLSEVGDAIQLAGYASGLGIPALGLTQAIDSHEASDKMKKLATVAKVATTDENRKKHDQRNNTTLPLYLLSMLGAGAGQAAASSNFVDKLRAGKAMPRQEWQGLVDHVAKRHVLVDDLPGYGNAAYHPGTDQIVADPRFGQAPVLAHEAGHALAGKERGLIGALQNYAYPFSYIAGPMAGAGSLAAGLALKNPWLGALAGAGIGGVTGAGTLIPEAAASIRGLAGLKSYQGGKFSSPGDNAMQGGAWGTYAAAALLPSILAGAAGGYVGRKRKQEAEASTPASDV